MRLALDIPLSQLNPSQRRFMRSTEPYLCYAAGYGSGKTTVGALKALYMASVNAGYPGLIVAPSWTHMKGVVFRTLRRIMLNSGVPLSEIRDLLHVKDPQGDRYLDWGGGTHILLRTAHRPGAIEGVEAAWAWLDEARLMSLEAYRVAVGRVRIKSVGFKQRFLTTTPAMHWLADHYDAGLDQHETIVGSTLENADNLDPDYIEGLRASFSRRMLRAILHGEFVPMEGLVFENFDPKDDQRFLDYPQKFVRRDMHQDTQLWIDPGIRRAAVLWVREIEPMKWLCFRQLMPTEQPMTDTIQQINQINHDEQIEIDRVWVDPAGDAREQVTGAETSKALAQGLNRRGQKRRFVCHVTGYYRSVAWRTDKTRVLLGDPEEHKPIRLYFSRELRDDERKNPRRYDNRGIVKSLSALQYPEAKDGKPIGEEPLKDGRHDHAVDSCGYGAVGLWLTSGLRNLDPVLSRDKGVNNAITYN